MLAGPDANIVSVQQATRQVPQHGLLATAAVLPMVNTLAQTATAEADHSTAPVAVVTDNETAGIPQAAVATSNNETAGHQGLTTRSYQWTGSMSDLYNPTEGSLDFTNVLRNPKESMWDTIDIHDPTAMELSLIHI